jgi:hypothetical protein|tara:strand:+ start:840 stop:1682 length:843 start_codon:yes stop_codon:yes gene_type:complete
MGHRKPNETTKDWLESAPLPSHGDTYTVVSHKEVIEGVEKSLKKGGFTIIRELYRANLNAKVAQGIYHLAHADVDTDSEMGMMFAWTNSYDKSTRFQCGIGAQVFVCNNGLIHGDLATYGRKHTGTANAEIASHIVNQIGLANNKFKQLIRDKDVMKSYNLSITKQSELLGRLFVEEKILDTQQIGIVKSEMEKPSFNYGVDPDTAWMFYNNVTHAFKKTHPRNWMDHQSKFHKFLTGEVYSAHVPQVKDTATKQPEVEVQPEDEMSIDVMDNIFETFDV